MLKLSNTFFLLFILLIGLGWYLSGCSWVERFIIFNDSEDTVSVKYILTPPDDNGFAIFDQYIECYAMKGSWEYDWNKEIKIIDQDTALLSFWFELPPKTALIFGNLHNDTYEKYDQYFINEGTFNLKKLEIFSPEKNITTTVEGFDQLFAKKKGIIGYTVN